MSDTFKYIATTSLYQYIVAKRQTWAFIEPLIPNLSMLTRGLPPTVREEQGIPAPDWFDGYNWSASGLIGDQQTMYRLLVEMAIVREVAAFDAYVSDILYRVCTEVPGILKTNRQTTHADVLQYKTIEDFTKSIGESQVMEWCHLSLSDLIEKLKTRHKVEINVDAKLMTMVIEYTEVRHIIVHNGGKVNNRYLERTGRSDVRPGQRLELNMNHTGECSQALLGLAIIIDKAIATHFKLNYMNPEERYMTVNVYGKSD